MRVGASIGTWRDSKGPSARVAAVGNVETRHMRDARDADRKMWQHSESRLNSMISTVAIALLDFFLVGL